MKSSFFYRVLFWFLGISLSSQAQTSVSNKNLTATIAQNGLLKDIDFHKYSTKVSFENKFHPGPQWYVQTGDTLVTPAIIGFDGNIQRANYNDLKFELKYSKTDDAFVIEATVTNTGVVPVQPVKMGLRLGMDTYMEKYPDWNQNFFPTLLRSEKTHFWGYFMSPLGKIMVVASPDPVASWSHDYSDGWNEGPYVYRGHHITSANIDFMNTLPLPERHPQDLWQLMPGEKKRFCLFLAAVDDLEKVLPMVAKLSQAPTIDIRKTGVIKYERVDFTVISDEEPNITIINPSGGQMEIRGENEDKGFKYNFTETSEEGLYQINATVANGKKTQASFYVRKSYSWYMQKAMKAVVDYPPKASLTHCESWYGFYTSFSGGKYFPKNKYLSYADNEFQKIYPIIFDTIKHEPKQHKFRIQNASSMIGVLVDRYELYGQEKDLTDAIGLAQFLMKSQHSDGAYRASASNPNAKHELEVDGAFRKKPTHYTCVIYIAKSLMELLKALEHKKDENEIYKQAYDSIYNSVRKAIDELESSRANIETEGGLTFEDGMISCSSLQLGSFALMQTDESDKTKYRAAALDMLKQHDCLEQLIVPDARMRSASLRFWEAQYDVLIGENFLNSTHGWSSWTTYANYYAYLLTGEPEYLERTFNGIDAAMQSLDLQGNMRWSFTPNPYLEVRQIYDNIEGSTPHAVKGMHYHVDKYDAKTYTIGEQYIDMVSDWFFANANDNDVHEHFKCLEEIALGKAYVVELPSGELVGYNCTVNKTKGGIVIEPSEPNVKKVHLNLQSPADVLIQFDGADRKHKGNVGLQWATK